MNETVKEIVRVLREGTPELQVAAAQILGEVRPRDAAVSEALGDVLENGDERILGRYILSALAKIGSPEAVRVLVGRLPVGDHLSDQVAHLLAEMGEPAHKALSEKFDEADPELRAKILAIFGRHASRDALRTLQKAVLDPVFAERAGEALLAVLDEIPGRSAKSLKTALVKELTRVEELDEAVVGVLLRVIARLDPQGSRPTLMKFAGDRFEPAVRRAALRAMTGLQLTPTQVKTLLGMLTDSEQKVLHPEIVEVLENIESWPDGALPTLKKLLQTKNKTLRLFALRALRTFHTAEVAKISMKFLGHQDAAFRDAAVAALSENPKAVENLLRSLNLERDLDKARVLAGILGNLGEHVPKKHFKSLTEKACKLLTAEEPMGEVLFDLLTTVDGVEAADLIVDKAVRLRRARRLPECLTLLARTARTPFLSDEGRYQLAVARLLVDSEQRPSEEAVTGDATMGYIGVLVRDGFPALDRLVRENMVSPAALLRVGTHFAEGVGAERRFGQGLLQHLAEKHSRDRTGEQARMVLRAEGLEV